MGIVVENEKRIFEQLGQLDRKVQRRVVRKATVAAGRVVLKEAQRQASSVRVTGFLRRSLRSVPRSRQGITTVRVGQRKQNRFKARKSTRSRGRNLSQLQRQGKPIPIHWIERGTKAHRINSRGSPLAFQVGRRTRGNNGLAFARFVRNPGMRPRRILGRTARLSRRSASAAWAETAAREMRQLR